MPVEKVMNFIKKGNNFIIQRNYLAALDCAQAVIKIDENNIGAHYMAASCLMNLSRFDEAIKRAEAILAVQPDYIGAYIVLAHIYRKQQYYLSQKAILEMALPRLRKNDILSAELYSMLGSVNVLLGESNKSAEYFLKSSCCESNKSVAVAEYSNYLLASNYIYDISQRELFIRHMRYNDFFKTIKRYTHTFRWRDKIKIGYLSADFNYHAVALFSLCLITGADKRQFEVFCYADIPHRDTLTEEFMKSADNWYVINGQTDFEIADKIYNDGIDILFDLGGHTARNHLSVLAYKPAPIQICGIGYFHSTGLKDVDYFIGDNYCDKLGESEQFFSEKVMRLPHTHWCYQPYYKLPNDNVEPPCLKNGYITFCSFNNFNKVSDYVLHAWQKILTRVVNSRLILKSKIFASKEARSFIEQKLKQMNFPLERIEFRGLSANYLEEYNDADIALDSFPYPGGATTCEALYMGVPVITLTGKRHGSRFGVSIMSNIGCKELIAESVSDYIKKSVYLAKNIKRIQKYKLILRKLMLKSPLMDKKIYMLDLEAQYKEVFRLWQYNNLNEAAKEVEKLIITGRYSNALNVCLDILQYVSTCGNNRQQEVVWTKIAEISRTLGDGKMAFQAYCKAFECSSERNKKIYQSMLLCLHDNNFERSVAADLHKNFAVLVPEVKKYKYQNKYLISRKIKIGYISADFKNHVMLNFISVFLLYFDENEFEIYCYMTRNEDNYTNNIKKGNVVWRNVYGLDAEYIADVINADSIDILVDFNGHSSGSNLEVMAFKPAPVQISGLGYFDLMGLSYIDYILADKVTYNINDEKLFGDKMLILENLFCYLPYKEVRNIQKVPFQQNGYITFGSFNNLCKLTDEVLVTWSKIINNVPNSKLLLKCDAFTDHLFSNQFKLKLKMFGIEKSELRPISKDYLSEYNDIDIALDSFPYNSGGAICDALFMGTPVITLQGKSFGACYGASILESANLEKFIANDIKEYIDIATDLANNIELLYMFNKLLRKNLQTSPLMDKMGYMKRLEKQYKKIFYSLR